jgi:hypothetical protein
MINVEEFLFKNNINSTYALVTYNNKTEPTWFTKYGDEDYGDWFLESPCELYRVMFVTEPIDDFAKKYAELWELEEGETYEDIANKYVKPMIVNGVLYSIENFQCSPYLPSEVDEIKPISEKECLEFLLKEVY